jgi:hypothetical protein
MTSEQEQALTEKLARLGYPDFEVLPGEDEVLMLHIQDRLICGVLHALSLPDEALKSLIDETVQVAGGQG